MNYPQKVNCVFVSDQLFRKRDYYSRRLENPQTDIRAFRRAIGYGPTA